jgi:hypothetical protein
LIFTEANALEADTSFFKISMSSSTFEEGGRRGRPLKGLFLSNFGFFMVVQYYPNYEHAAKLSSIFVKNNSTRPIS